MVSAVKWQAAPTITEIMTTQLNGLSDKHMTTASSEVDNSVNLDTFGWFQLFGGFSVAPTASNPSIDLYMATAPDGTNYEPDPVTGGTDQGHMYVGSFPIQKLTGSKYWVIGPFALPPMKFKVFLDNQTLQAMYATLNTLSIITNNLEGQ